MSDTVKTPAGNPIIKVCGHHRSGNNYLMALMWKNFYSGRKDLAMEIDLKGRTYYLFGKPHTGRVTIPYLKLGAGTDYLAHDPRAVTKNSVYIIRRWKPIEMSLAKLKHEVPKHFANDKTTHMYHIYMALRGQPYVVYYEELCSDPAKVLLDIQGHFALNRLYKWFVTEVGFCGFKE